MRMVDIIEKKRDGKSLSKEEIEFLSKVTRMGIFQIIRHRV